MDAATIAALIQGLGPFGAVMVLAAYAFWSRPKDQTMASVLSPEYERGMIAAMQNAASALQSIAKSTDLIERHLSVLLDRRH